MIGEKNLKIKKTGVVAVTIALIGIGYKYNASMQTSAQSETENTIRVKQNSNDNETTFSDTNEELANKNFKNGSDAYMAVNGDKSTLKATDWKNEKIDYSALDDLNRTSVDTAYLSKRNLGKSEGRTRQIWNPAGWHNQPVNIDGHRITLQNRGHLIAYTLTFNFDQDGNYEPGQPGSLDNPLNLATQSEYSNQKTMQIFEEKVRNALTENKKVIYRVQTVFRGNELMPRGYWVQAISTDGILNFNDYVWNIEPGVSFDYSTGRSTLNSETQIKNVANSNSKRHFERSVDKLLEW